MNKYYGLIDYQTALELQKKEHLRLQVEGNPYFIMAMEHEPVVSLGIRGKSEEDLLISEKELIKKGYSIERSDRGGQATLHMPGQLVIYPLVNLKHYQMGIKDFVCELLKISKEVLKEKGLVCETKEGEPGLFTSFGKIAFIGLRLRNHITYHGLSINISNDLEAFRWIRSCGIKEARLDSLSRNGLTISSKDFFDDWMRAFQKRF